MDQIRPLPLETVTLTNGMLLALQKLVRDKVLPYQWEALHDRVPGAAKSHCIENFRIAAGLAQGEYYGMVFQDSDLYKWLEAAAYCLAVFADEALEAQADEMCGLIANAQGSDGYINTYYTIKEPEGRFSNLQEGHELYCAGHFFEAAVAYYKATGKRLILDIACRFADYLVKTFGTGAGQIPGYPGHQEVEVGLVKLYEATGNSAYLKLARYFIAQRGKEPFYFDLENQNPAYRDIFHQAVIHERTYAQCHTEPVKQTEAVGHVVRALYMFSAMADLARLTGDPALGDACHRLYDSVTKRRMYITGGVGSTAYGESFTCDYDLPNDTMYCEGCASVALMMFAQRMALFTGDGNYFDTVERAFFNRVLGGISVSGTEFFYVGPLQVNPSACKCNPGLAHVMTVRQKWFDVACCPTNTARTIMSIGRYALGEDGDTLYIHIPVPCRVQSDRFHVEMQTQYPFGDTLRIEVMDREQRIAVRQSGNAAVQELRVNGQLVQATLEHGYYHLPALKPGDVVLVKYALPVRYAVSHPKVTDNVGKAAVMRGPIVYCAEQADNGEGIAGLRLPHTPSFFESEAFWGNGTVALAMNGTRAVFTSGDELYRDGLPDWEDAQIKLIPYFLWANRGEGEMRVYLNVAAADTCAPHSI